MSKKLLVALFSAASITALAACTGAPATPQTTAAPASETSAASTDTSSAAATTDATTEPATESPAELSGEITYQTWALKGDKFTPYFEKLTADFMAEHPGVTINWVDQPPEGYEEKLLQQVNSNDLPDVINISGTGQALLFAEQGFLMNLDEAAPGLLDAYIQGPADQCTFDGGRYCLPWYQGTDLTYWNMAELEKAGVTDASTLPTTNDELLDFAIKVAQDSDGAVKVLPEAPRLGTLSNAGIPLANEDETEWIFNTPEAVALLNKYKEAYDAGALPPEALAGDWQGHQAMFKQGKVAYAPGPVGFAGELQADAPTLVENVQVAPRIGIPASWGQAIVVSGKSENPELALAFADYLTNNANQIAFVELAQGWFPGTVEANGNPESFTSVIEDPLTKSALDIASTTIKDAQTEYPTISTDEGDTFFKQQVALVLQGSLSAEEALQKSQDHLNELLNS